MLDKEDKAIGIFYTIQLVTLVPIFALYWIIPAIQPRIELEIPYGQLFFLFVIMVILFYISHLIPIAIKRYKKNA